MAIREHKKVSKEERQKIYNKYDGHCAYCGCKIEYEEMVVDKIIPTTTHNIENVLDYYHPSCWVCKTFKGSVGVEEFKKRLKDIPDKLRSDFSFRMAERYGIVEEHYDPVTFYFEQFIHKRSKPPW